MSDAPTGSRPAAGVRDQLVAELQRTVDTVTAAVDAAAAQTIEAAEVEARRRARAVSERLAAASEGELARMVELSAELVRRANDLERDVAALAALAEQARRDLEPVRTEAQPPPVEGPASDGPEPTDPLDRVEQAREQLVAASVQAPPRRRFRRKRAEGVPEGVRVMVVQMRLAGRSDQEIAGRLQEMGIEDAAELLARVND